MKKFEFFKVEGDKINRVRRHCPKCGPAVFIAEHKDRFSCGKCGYTEFKGGGRKQPEPKTVKIEDKTVGIQEDIFPETPSEPEAPVEQVETEVSKKSDVPFETKSTSETTDRPSIEETIDSESASTGEEKSKHSEPEKPIEKDTLSEEKHEKSSDDKKDEKKADSEDKKDISD
jgi:small subunit ribosomal protein S27Ae